jgi:hypothetical protein
MVIAHCLRSWVPLFFFCTYQYHCIFILKAEKTIDLRPKDQTKPSPSQIGLLSYINKGEENMKRLQATCLKSKIKKQQNPKQFGLPLPKNHGLF